MITRLKEKSTQDQRIHTVYDVMKRYGDIIGSVIGLIISAPLSILAIILIKLDGGTILFSQERVGLDDKLFNMLKFRTMVPGAHKLETYMRQEHAANGGYGVAGNYSDPRITKVGAALRLLNIDELPQFINVLKGEMSLIGPRPVPYEESLLYGNKRDEILSVKPGLTGYWQVKRRMSTDYDERVDLDIQYVRNRGLLLDLYIFFLTPITMITSDYNSVTKPLPPLTENTSDLQPKAVAAKISLHKDVEPLAESKIKDVAN